MRGLAGVGGRRALVLDLRSCARAVARRDRQVGSAPAGRCIAARRAAALSFVSVGPPLAAFLVLRSTNSLRLSIAFEKHFAGWGFPAVDTDDVACG